jgi:hypothetical protein
MQKVMLAFPFQVIAARLSRSSSSKRTTPAKVHCASCQTSQRPRVEQGLHRWRKGEDQLQHCHNCNGYEDRAGALDALKRDRCTEPIADREQIEYFHRDQGVQRHCARGFDTLAHGHGKLELAEDSGGEQDRDQQHAPQDEPRQDRRVHPARRPPHDRRLRWLEGQCHRQCHRTDHVDPKDLQGVIGKVRANMTAMIRLMLSPPFTGSRKLITFFRLA